MGEDSGRPTDGTQSDSDGSPTGLTTDDSPSIRGESTDRIRAPDSRPESSPDSSRDTELRTDGGSNTGDDTDEDEKEKTRDAVDEEAQDGTGEESQDATAAESAADGDDDEEADGNEGADDTDEDESATDDGDADDGAADSDAEEKTPATELGPGPDTSMFGENPDVTGRPVGPTADDAADDSVSADSGDTDERRDDESDGESDDDGADAEDDDADTEDDGAGGEDDSTEGEDDSTEGENDGAEGADEALLTEEEYQEELEQAAETNPPLERDEAIHLDRDDEPPTEDTDEIASSIERDTDDEPLFEGPETDEEMPLAVHIEEMMRRLGIVFLVGGVATLIAFPSAEILIEYFWSTHIPSPEENRPRLYGPLEFLLTKLKVAGLAGVVLGLPVFVFQTYRFMKPGLYQHERRYYLAAVPTSLVLGLIGGLFAHFLVLPAIFAYFTAYTEGAAVIAFGLAETFNLIVMMIAMMAVVFQIPLFIMLAIMMNLTTREWLEDKRLIFWGAFFGVAFIFSPDPTGMAPIIVTLTMIVLFEGTLALLRWTGN